MNAAKACLFAGVLLVPVFFANAQNATLHPDRDAFICDCQGNANNPGGPLTKLYQGPYYTGGHQCYARTVLHWALTGLPQTGNILSATLQMKCTARYGTLTGRMAFYRIVEDWGATTVTYNSMPRHTSQDSILADWPAVNQWLSVDVTQLVRFFVAHPDSNFGIYGHSANTAGGTGAVELNSSRFSDSLGWPVLAIQFEPNGVRM